MSDKFVQIGSADGLIGPSGATGIAGPEGATGVTGSTGSTGPTGPSGSQGATGVTGTVGSTGPQGTFYAQATPPGSSSIGDVWFDTNTATIYVYYDSYWVEWSAGTIGPVGPTGPQGDASTVPGPTGPQGATGVTGSTGPTGVQGPTGPQGVFYAFDTAPLSPSTGDVWFDTASAIIYVRYDGYWVEWSAGVIGPDGATGVTGATGTTGATGITGATGTASLPAGIISPYAGSSAPTGYLLCDGLAVSRTTYATLFAVTGTTYGVGDGSTTFNLPDLRGRVPVGVDGAAARLSANDALGNSSGAETHTLTTSEMPSHSHDGGSLTTSSDGAHTHTTRATQITTNTATGGSNALTTLRSTTGGNEGNTSSSGAHTHTSFTGNTGGAGLGLAHNNMQPYQVTQYIIKT